MIISDLNTLENIEGTAVLGGTGFGPGFSSKNQKVTIGLVKNYSPVVVKYENNPGFKNQIDGLGYKGTIGYKWH